MCQSRSRVKFFHACTGWVRFTDYYCIIPVEGYKEATIVFDCRVDGRRQLVKVKAVTVRFIVLLVLLIIHKMALDVGKQPRMIPSMVWTWDLGREAFLSFS
jgi:hypothetical protein